MPAVQFQTDQELHIGRLRYEDTWYVYAMQQLKLVYRWDIWGTAPATLEIPFPGRYKSVSGILFKNSSSSDCRVMRV